MRRLTIADLWSRTRIEGSCIVWTGARMYKGYGLSAFCGRKWRVHRLFYYLALGVTPEVILHTCDNRACVKLQHLEAGTHVTNRQDTVNKERHARGRRATSPKISSTMAAEIRLRHSAGESMRQLARLYGVTPWTIKMIVAGRT